MSDFFWKLHYATVNKLTFLILLRLQNQSWLRYGIFSGLWIPIPEIFYFGLDRKIPKIPKSRGSWLGYQNLKIIPKNPGIEILIWQSRKNPRKIPEKSWVGSTENHKIPGIEFYFEIFYPQDQDFLRRMGYPDKQWTGGPEPINILHWEISQNFQQRSKVYNMTSFLQVYKFFPRPEVENLWFGLFIEIGPLWGRWFILVRRKWAEKLNYRIAKRVTLPHF